MEENIKNFFKIIGMLLVFSVVATIVIIIISMHFKVINVEAAELPQEEITAAAADEDVDADEELMLFGYYTEPGEPAAVLTKIYNLLLTIFYAFIINEGRKIIIRNIRKGHVRNGFFE